MGYIEDLKAAKDGLAAANKEHNTAVKNAEQAEKKARKEHETAVAKAEKALKTLEANWRKTVATMGRLKLYANRVDGPNISLDITEGVESKVDVSGVLKKRGYITLTSKSGQIVEEFDPKLEKEAREFAAKVVNQGTVAGDAQARYVSDAARLNEEIAKAKEDTSAIDAAVAAVQAAREDTAAVDQATKHLEEVQSSATEEDLAAAKEHEDKARKKKLTIGGIAAAVALIAMLFATHTICFHNWQAATCTEPETCSICGRTKGEALGHSWIDATCTKPKTCELCGETTGKALGHQIDDWKTTKQATCTNKGEREGTCTRCGEKQVEEIAKKDHEFGKWSTTQEATCTAEGVATRKCKNCDKTETKSIAKPDHTPGDWEVLTAPKVNSDGTVSNGTKVRKCTVCGAELDTESYTLDLTMGQRNALAKAASYLSFTSFSFSGLVDQLEFEGFSTEDATFAAENCGADWNEQAARKAQSYLDYTSFSRDGLIDQLLFEGFTREQVEYGVTAVGY